MIQARRGLITVLDRGKQPETAGGSHAGAKVAYERLVGPSRQHDA